MTAKPRILAATAQPGYPVLRRLFEQDADLAFVFTIAEAVARLQAERARNAVAVAIAGDGAGARFGVRARVFVLAAGAIETARLLLLAGREPEPRLVIPDSAGRCFMDHFYVAAGRFRPPDPRLFNRAGLYDLRPLGGTLTMGKLRPTEGLMRRRRLLNHLPTRPRPTNVVSTISIGEASTIRWRDASFPACPASVSGRCRFRSSRCPGR